MKLDYKITEEYLENIIHTYEENYKSFSNEEREEIENYIINGFKFLNKYFEDSELFVNFMDSKKIPDVFKLKVEKLLENESVKSDDFECVFTSSQYIKNFNTAVSKKLLSAFDNERSTSGPVIITFDIDIKKFKGEIVSLVKGHNYGGDYGAVEFMEFKKIGFSDNENFSKYNFSKKELDKLFLKDVNPDICESTAISMDLSDSEIYEKLISNFSDGIVKVYIEGKVFICEFS